MTKLAPPRTIKTAIMKMDSTIINREGIEVLQKHFVLFLHIKRPWRFSFLFIQKLLTMLPTDEERAKIQEAQFANVGLSHSLFWFILIS